MRSHHSRFTSREIPGTAAVVFTFPPHAFVSRLRRSAGGAAGGTVAVAGAGVFWGLRSPFQLLGAPSERIWPSLPDLPNVRSGKIDVLGVPHRYALRGWETLMLLSLFREREVQ